MLLYVPDDCLDNQVLDAFPDPRCVDALSFHVAPQRLETPEMIGVENN